MTRDDEHASAVGRRRALITLTGLALPGLLAPLLGAGPARGQVVVQPIAPTVPAVPMPMPAVPAPIPPPAVTPLPPQPRPAAQAGGQVVARPTAAGGVDRSKTYYLFFDQEVTLASMHALRRQLSTLVEAGVQNITIVLDSGGGLMEPALVTYSFIRSLPVHINMHAQHLVASAATILFLAGDVRSADPIAVFGFHPALAPIMGFLNEQQAEDSLAVLKSVVSAAERIYRRRTSLPDSEIAAFGQRQVLYDAEQARRFGIVQSVAELRIPAGTAKILFVE
jgi:ATP-dependent protease ClpP protease subunit